MKRLCIDLSECQTIDSIYTALLSELGAPSWHGRNLDALWDSITDGDINKIKPPYYVEVQGADRLPLELVSLLTQMRTLFEDVAAEQEIDVRFKIA